MSNSEQTFEQELLEDRLAAKRSKLSSFQQRPQKQINARLSELNDAITQTTLVNSAQPSNRSMNKHLTLLKAGLERDPDAWVNWRVAEIESAIDNLKDKLDSL